MSRGGLVVVLLTEKAPRDGAPARVRAAGHRAPLVDDLRDAMRFRDVADARAWIEGRPDCLRGWLPSIAPLDGEGVGRLPGGEAGAGRQTATSGGPQDRQEGLSLPRGEAFGGRVDSQGNLGPSGPRRAS
jgi:hypothetical protein